MKAMKAKKPKVETVEVKIKLRLSTLPPGAYEGEHLDLRLGGRERTLLNRLFRGLNASNERLDTTKVVASRPDALRWLLRQLADAVDGER